MTHHTDNIKKSGVSAEKADKAFIMLHGRGAPAEDILGLAKALNINNAMFVAPQATNNTWYPFSFMAPQQENEPWLSSALELIGKIEKDLLKKGFTSEQIYLLGFSQGACLASEYAARNAKKYGGIFALTGGLIGDNIDPANYNGDFEGTPVFLANSDQDPHIPVERSQETEQVYRKMNADVTLKIYPDMPHTVIQEEIEIIESMVSGR